MTEDPTSWRNLDWRRDGHDPKAIPRYRALAEARLAGSREARKMLRDFLANKVWRAVHRQVQKLGRSYPEASDAITEAEKTSFADWTLEFLVDGTAPTPAHLKESKRKRVLKSWLNLPSPCPLTAYLTPIIDHYVEDLIKAHWSRFKLIPKAPPISLGRSDEEVDPIDIVPAPAPEEDNMERQETRQWIAHGISKMKDDEQRRILEWLHLEGASVKEIAEELGTSPQTVYRKLKETSPAFADILEQLNPDLYDIYILRPVRAWPPEGGEEQS